MAWSVRTTAPTYGTSPYDWTAETRGQCTWYAYWRVQEEGYTPPCWQSGSGSSGSGKYNNASTWLAHYRTPWEVKSTSYTPVAGDLAVFSTSDPAGHVCVIESVSGSYAMITDYNINLDESFSYRRWTIGGGIGSTGVLIGYLHYPSSTPPTPTPSEDLELTITPTYYSVTMTGSETYVDFQYSILLTGLPSGASASGNNTYPDLIRVQNTGWSYTDYVIDGVTYRQASKTQTLRYIREYDTAYTTTKYMYFSFSYSTGTINSTTPMYINVLDRDVDEDTMVIVLSNMLKRKKKFRIKIK